MDFCAVHAGDAKIFGRLACSHLSPVATLQSCMSLQRFGVIHAKFGVVAAEVRSVLSAVYATSWLAQRAALVRTSL